MNRVPTGVTGFDKLVSGGFPEHAAILISGAPGTGKSIFALEFAYHGAKKFNEVSMYISFEQTDNDLKEQASQMGMTDIAALEKKGKLLVRCIPLNSFSAKVIPNLLREAKNKKVKRIVIDSLSALLINAPLYDIAKFFVWKDVSAKSSMIEKIVGSDDIKKNFIYKFIAQIEEIPATSMFLSEIQPNSEAMSSDGVSEFVCDGVLVVKKTTIGEEINRTIHIEKLRKTKLSVAMKDFEFTGKGIVVG